MVLLYGTHGAMIIDIKLYGWFVEMAISWIFDISSKFVNSKKGMDFFVY